MQGKRNTPKSASNPDFDDVCLWYQMEFANYSFEVARDVIKSIFEEKLDNRSLDYYAMTVGLAGKNQRQVGTRHYTGGHETRPLS
jgi:hypothetical protein